MGIASADRGPLQDLEDKKGKSPDRIHFGPGIFFEDENVIEKFY